jgi:ubiquinone/menaquinone biosynthesis C-methylase UbiE
MTRVPNPFSAPEPWDAVADGYADEASFVMLPFSRDAVALAQPHRDAAVLDVACGPGTLTLSIADQVGTVDALDFSRPMLDRLQRAAAAARLDNVRVQQGDGQALPYEPSTFDAAFSMFGLMFFPDRARGFAELHRVLKPNGVAVVSSWLPIEESSLMRLMFGAVRAIDPSRPAPQYDPASLENPELFRQELEGAGFADVKVQSREHEINSTSAQDLWARMARSSAPLVMLRRKLGETEWATQSAKAQRFIEGEFANGPRELSVKAWLGFGRKS